MESGTARLAISNDDTNHDSGDCDLTVLLVSVYGETRARESRHLCDLAERNHPYRKREDRTCGYVSTRPRTLQLDMSVPKVNKYETSMVSVCLRGCRKISWQTLVAENTTGIMKGTRTRIALEKPIRKFMEGLESAVLAHNEMERARGLSPTQ